MSERNYPKEFIRKVHELYDVASIHHLVNNPTVENHKELGSVLEVILGNERASIGNTRCLAFTMTPEEILDKIDSGKIEEIRQEVKRAIKKKDVYAQWLHIDCPTIFGYPYKELR